GATDVPGDDQGRESGRQSFGFRSYADDTPRDLGPDEDLDATPPAPPAPALESPDTLEDTPDIESPRPTDFGPVGYDAAPFGGDRARRGARWPFILAGGVALAVGAVAGAVLPIADLLPRATPAPTAQP